VLTINQLKQAAIEAAANVTVQENALNALLDAEAGAKKTYGTLLRAAAASDYKETEDSKKKLAEAEAHVEGFPARLSAQRKLVSLGKTEQADADAALKAETERLAKEDAELAKKPSGRVVVGAANAEKDPKRGFADHRDYLGSVMRAGMGMGVDERLKPLATQGTDEQQTASNPYGGYLVPHGVAPGILSVGGAVGGDPITPRCTPVPMTSPSVSFNARVDKNHATSVTGGFRVYRRPETVDGTSSRTEFEQVTLRANGEFGVAFASEEIITDSPSSFIAIIQAGYRDEYAAASMREHISGTGVGERQGLLNSGCLIEVAADPEQDADTITVTNIDNMAMRSWRYSQSVYMANHGTRAQLRGLVRNVGTGGVPVPYFTTNPDGQEYLDGRPIFFTEFCTALGNVGDLINADFSQYLEGTYESEQYAESIHVRFLANERTFRFYRRNDGQWWWRAALTPANGPTLSPVVVLAAR
jgi:HK97 family phage major capsid protein